MQETGRHHSAFYLCSVVSASKIEDRVPIDDAFEMIEDMVLSAVIEKVCRRDVRRIGYGRFPKCSDETVGVLEREWAEKNGVDDGENCRVCPMPSASVNTAMAVKPKFLPSVRRAIAKICDEVF